MSLTGQNFVFKCGRLTEQNIFFLTFLRALVEILKRLKVDDFSCFWVRAQRDEEFFVIELMNIEFHIYNGHLEDL